MTVSRLDSKRTPLLRRLHAVLLLLAVGVLMTACRTATMPGYRPLERSGIRPAIVPDEEDFLARDLMIAALLNDSKRAQFFASEIQKLEMVKPKARAPRALAPLAQNVVDSTLDDHRSYRRATRKLIKGKKLPKGLKKRLEQEVADDPLLLSKARLKQNRQQSFGRLFNSLAAPVGHSLLSYGDPTITFSRAVLQFAVGKHMEDDFSVFERQALYQWQEYLRRYPNAENAAELEERVHRATAELRETRHDQNMRKARRALRHNRPREALAYSMRASNQTPESSKATKLAHKAAKRVEEQRSFFEQSLQAPAELSVDDSDAYNLSVALLKPTTDLDEVSSNILEANPKGSLKDEATYALALTQRERGSLDSASRQLKGMTKWRGKRSNMARHAYALLSYSRQNPYKTFRLTRKRDGYLRTRWILFGPYAQGAKEKDLPRVIEWILDVPHFFDAVTGMPQRILQYPWMKPWPFGRVPYRFAQDYIREYPEGPHANEVLRWIEKYEKRRGNSIGALRVARQRTPDATRKLKKLENKASNQALKSARGQKRPEIRIPLLQQIVRDYPETKSGHEAGMLVRAELSHLSSQQIRISRGFLEENPRIAGPDGLGLRPELLDEDFRNGELHVLGVTLEGKHVLAVHYLSESGKKKDPPTTVREKISEDRLSRFVALLEESSISLSLVDRDYTHGLDAERDLFFEKARLGVADSPEKRIAARSEYVFQGVRETYGLVRSRESILPVELVIQGSATDFSLGAFPRMKMPKSTPDAVFYQ